MRPDLSATFSVGGALDLTMTLRVLQRGGGNDPTVRIGDGAVWRASRTPDGPATLRLELDRGRLRADAWGAGSVWAMERVPTLAGLDDDPSAFFPRHPLLHEIHRRHLGLRLGRTSAVVEAVIPTVLEQKVPGLEARWSYSRLVRAVRDPAPGPGGLLLPPSPAQLLALPYWSVHRFGIEARRWGVIRTAALHARRLEELVSMPFAEAQRRLMTLPGLGPWSAAEVAAVALGDRDAVSIGDYHLPHQVSWALAGEVRGTDDRMLQLLEPYRGHRARVIRLLNVAGIQAPRFGPRMPLRRIAAY